MKIYERAKQKRLSLHSIKYDTISLIHAEEVQFTRQNKTRVIPTDKQDDGKRRNQSGRDCSENWCCSPQHQQNFPGERVCNNRLSFKNCGEHELGPGVKTAKTTQRVASDLQEDKTKNRKAS